MDEPREMIVTQEFEHGEWCDGCLLPAKVTIIVYANDIEIARLEGCPGCRTGAYADGNP